MGDGYYDQIASGYDELHGEEQLRKAKLVLESLEVSPSDSLLDVGCGTAHYLSIFPCKKQGIDPSAELLKKASIPVVQGVAESLPFADSYFDIVLSLTAIHHCSDVKKAVSEMLRVSRRDTVISVLRKSQKFKEVEQVLSALRPHKRVDELHDVIFFIRKTLNKQ